MSMTAYEYLIKELKISPNQIIDNSLNVNESQVFKTQLYEAFGDEHSHKSYYKHYRNPIISTENTIILNIGSPIAGCKYTRDIGFSLDLLIWAYTSMNQKPLITYGLKGNNTPMLDNTKFYKLKMWKYIQNLYNNITINEEFINENFIKSLPINKKRNFVISCVNGSLDCNLEYLKLLQKKFPNSLMEFWVWSTTLYNKYKNSHELGIKKFDKDLKKNKLKGAYHHKMNGKPPMYVYRTRGNNI